MRYFIAKIKSKANKGTTKRSLESLLKNTSNDFFIFPFCLFNKSFYSSLKEKRSRPFEGRINDVDFELFKTVHYGSTSGGKTSREIKIKGEIIEEKDCCFINLEFHTSTIESIIEIIIFLGCLIAYTINNNTLFLAVPIILLFERVRFTISSLVKIKRRISKTNVP